MMQMEFLVGCYCIIPVCSAQLGEDMHTCLSELQSPTGRTLQPSVCSNPARLTGPDADMATRSAPHLH